MARYAGGGKNTVESCRSIDVFRWNKIGYLRTPRWFSWAWTRDGEQVASINVETQRHCVMQKYRNRPYGEDWSDVEQRVAVATSTVALANNSSAPAPLEFFRYNPSCPSTVEL